MEVLGRDSAGGIDDSLPGDVAGTLVHGPADSAGGERSAQEAGDLPIAHHSSARYPADDGSRSTFRGRQWGLRSHLFMVKPSGRRCDCASSPPRVSGIITAYCEGSKSFRAERPGSPHPRPPGRPWPRVRGLYRPAGQEGRPDPVPRRLRRAPKSQASSASSAATSSVPPARPTALTTPAGLAPP